MASLEKYDRLVHHTTVTLFHKTSQVLLTIARNILQNNPVESLTFVKEVFFLKDCTIFVCIKFYRHLFYYIAAFFIRMLRKTVISYDVVTVSPLISDYCTDAEISDLNATLIVWLCTVFDPSIEFTRSTYFRHKWLNAIVERDTKIIQAQPKQPPAASLMSWSRLPQQIAVHEESKSLPVSNYSNQTMTKQRFEETPQICYGSESQQHGMRP